MLTGLSLRKKTVLSFLFLVAVMSFVFALTSYYSTLKSMHSEIQKRGIEVVKTLSQLVAPSIFISDYVTVLDNTDQLIKHSDIQFLAIFDTIGASWLASNKDHLIGSIDTSFYQNIINSNIVGHRKVKKDGHNIMEFVSPISALGKVVYLLKIEISLESIENQALQRSGDAVLIGCIMVVAVTFFGVLFSKLLTDPIEKLVRGTNEISHGNLTHRIAVSSNDEIGVLSQSFNYMTDSLEKELTTRKNVERALEEHRDKLEETVSKRTAQLTLINQQISHEIEEHRKTERALRESDERYRRFSEVTVDGIVFHNKAGIIDTNTTFSRLFGFSQKELLGKGFIESICFAEDQESIRKKFDSKGDLFVETIGKRKDGTTMPIEIHNRALQDNSGTLLVTSVRDISERKQLEVQLHQAQKMKSIGLMAGGVAHDLNNILSGIVTYPEVLLLDLPQDSHLRMPLEMIKESGMRAAEVVSDLLTVARGAASSRELNNVNKLVEEYIGSPEYKRLEEQYPGVILKTDLDLELYNISCSPVHVKKSLMNLVANAAEAIGDEGKILISTRNQYVNEPISENQQLKEGEYVVISVSDSGPGIAEKDIQHIFDPFYSRKRMDLNSGSGLGLTVVWNTAQDHGGGITVESSVMATIFLMYFPATREEIDIQLKVVEGENLHGSGERILVVDDEENQRVITSRLLGLIGYHVDVVGSGEDAVKYLQTHEVELLILDMIMADGMTGRQTYSRIIKQFPGMKAIIVSGFSAGSEVKKAQKLGAGAYLKKPFTLDQIGSAIKEALQA